MEFVKPRAGEYEKEAHRRHRLGYLKEREGEVEVRHVAAREGDAGEEADGHDVHEPRLEGDVLVLLQRNESRVHKHDGGYPAEEHAEGRQGDGKVERRHREDVLVEQDDAGRRRKVADAVEDAPHNAAAPGGFHSGLASFNAGHLVSTFVCVDVVCVSGRAWDLAAAPTADCCLVGGGDDDVVRLSSVGPPPPTLISLSLFEL